MTLSLSLSHGLDLHGKTSSYAAPSLDRYSPLALSLEKYLTRTQFFLPEAKTGWPVTRPDLDNPWPDPLKKFAKKIF